MSKKRVLWFVVFALTLIMSIGIAAACHKDDGGSNSGDSVTVEWQLSHASVSVDDYTTPPESVPSGTKLTFTVTPDSGYEVDNVKVNNRTIAAGREDKYSATIRDNSVISVATQPVIDELAITTMPDTTVYYQGQEVDTTGMVVEVTYATGETKTLTEDEYTVVYTDGAFFGLGDTSFAVRYRGVESEPVEIPAVEVLITIDPAGGTLAEEYLTALEANTEIKNYAQDPDTGVITFSFATLENAIALPTADQWTRGEEGDFTFSGWTGGATEIAAGTEESKTLTANYLAALLKLDRVYYANETESTEDGEEEVPYLIIEGTFVAAKEAYLFLYEGNDKVELKGTTIGGPDTKRGDEFVLKFDMRKLVEAQYLGKWMDIKFVAQEGDREEVQEINVDEYPEGFVDTAQILVNGKYAYSFQTYDGGNGRMLKALYSNYFKNEYTMTASQDSDGKPVITISGEVSTEYAGKTACIDIELGGIHEYFGVIGNDGKYTVTINLDSYALDTDGYFHFRIVESAENSGAVIQKDGDGNLLNSGCQNTDLVNMNFGLIENNGALTVSNKDGSKVFYVGFGKWGGIVVRGRNEAIVTTGVTLEMKDGKPCLVVEGTYGAAVTDIVDKLSVAYADVQNNADTGSGSPSTNPDWGSPTVFKYGAEAPETDTMFIEAADGVWKIYLDLSARNNTVGEALFSHFSLEGATGTNLESANIDTEASVSYVEADGDNLTVTLEVFKGWNNTNLVSIRISGTPAAEPAA